MTSFIFHQGQSLDQGRLGLPDGCGFVALWNALCFVCEQEEARLKGDAFLTRYHQWLKYAGEVSVRRTSDLSVSLLHFLATKDSQIREALQDKLILIPLGYNLDTLGGDDIREWERKLRLLSQGRNTRCSIVSSIPGHYFCLLISVIPRSRNKVYHFTLCDSQNRVSFGQIEEQRTFIVESLRSFEIAQDGRGDRPLSKHFLNYLVSQYVQGSKRFIEKHGIEAWQSEELPGEFYDILLRRFRGILYLARDLGVDTLDGTAPKNLTWLRQVSEQTHSPSGREVLWGVLSLLGASIEEGVDEMLPTAVTVEAPNPNPNPEHSKASSSSKTEAAQRQTRQPYFEPRLKSTVTSSPRVLGTRDTIRISKRSKYSCGFRF